MCIIDTCPCVDNSAALDAHARHTNDNDYIPYYVDILWYI